MSTLDTFSEEIGYYQVEYLRFASDAMGCDMWVYRATALGTSPIPIPKHKHGNGVSLSDARNNARESIPGAHWSPRLAGIDPQE